MHLSPADMLPEWKKGKARLNRTTAALLIRGMDQDTAAKLIAAGWNLKTLQQEHKERLEQLGLRLEWIDNIHTSKRPPIPFDTVARVLIASRFTCCVCREAGRGVILHHIIGWAKSHDHSEKNLAALCLEHHDQAHSKLAHTQNLTPRLIRQAKSAWQQYVAHLDTSAILTATSFGFDCWWYFNRFRLFAMANDLNLQLGTLSRFEHALGDGWISPNGHLRRDRRKSQWSLEGGYGNSLYAYLAQILDHVIAASNIFNISDDLDRSLLAVTLARNDLRIAPTATSAWDHRSVWRS